MTDLSVPSKTVVERCLAVQPGENVLVVCAPSRVDIAEALHAAAAEAGGDSVLMILPPKPAVRDPRR